VSYLQHALELNPKSEYAMQGMRWALNRLGNIPSKEEINQPYKVLSDTQPIIIKKESQTLPAPAIEQPKPAADGAAAANIVDQFRQDLMQAKAKTAANVSQKAVKKKSKPAQKRSKATFVSDSWMQDLARGRKFKTAGRFFSHWQNWIGLLLVAMFVFVAIAAPVLSPQDPENPGSVKVVGSKRDFVPHPPSLAAPLGTLSRQVSVYHSIVWGARSSIVFGLVVVAFAMIMGVLIGAVSAYFGGFLNDLLMRITDSFLAFPMIASVVFINQIFSIVLYNAGIRYMGSPLTMDAYHAASPSFFVPPNLPYWLTLLQQINPVSVAFILFSWMPFARIMNTIVLRIKKTDYILAARALGVRNFRIIVRHMLPNALAPVIVLAARDVGGMVLLQATFTFIGLGGDSPWGMLLANGRDWIISAGGIFTYWWVFLPATLALVLFGIGWNLMGDGLNDALNPREV
jgi:peptide/nickel transport system permease protein